MNQALPYQFVTTGQKLWAFPAAHLLGIKFHGAKTKDARGNNVDELVFFFSTEFIHVHGVNLRLLYDDLVSRPRGGHWPLKTGESIPISEKQVEISWIGTVSQAEAKDTVKQVE